MDFIEREQPDVLLLEAEQYEKYIGKGLLMELDPLIQRDHYDLQSVYPTITELLQEKGQGKMYGLSPRFYGTAVFYNQALFEQNGIALPREKMTWDELLELAGRFPLKNNDGKRIYGFGLRDGATVDALADRMASTEGLTTVNPNQKKVVIASDAWKQIMRLAVDACGSGHVYSKSAATGKPGQAESETDPFIQGNMAMTVDDLYLLNDLKRAKNRDPKSSAFPLGVVAGPVDPRTRFVE
ncbi:MULTISPECIES: ABC transporter substrate-binding protein [Paenibacillus]|uniref:ABC transporter substrate-binding protein n=1 Tax=Paenibacillus TaxID=44249 RepID=UPI002FE38776